MEVIPDGWVVLKVSNNGEVYHKVFATWDGSYLHGDSWRINSGILSVKEEEHYYLFKGFSGSVYKCHKAKEGVIRGVGDGVLQNLLNTGICELIKASDYMNLD